MVYAVPKFILDPRRPVVPSQESKDEGLLVFHPFIEFNPKHVLSYSRNVQSRSLATSETGLESTTLVLTSNGDLFFTKRSPSREFDALSEEFGYFGLTITIIGLILSIHGCKVLVERKKIIEAWK